MSSRTLLALSVVLLGCPPKPRSTQVPPPQLGDPLAEPLPVDAAVRSGVLDNGLTWFVEVNREPAKRAVLRLAVDAGSILEDEDQLGVAHFVEHMAFNGTKNFPGNELITYLEGVGTRFGPHLNAHTSFDETVYKLVVPTDDEEVFEKGILVLADWAGGLTFDDEEIEKERPVVLEEWRTRLGPRERIMDKTLPELFWGSPYPDRLPIGTEASLKSFEPDAARRYYTDWYRPDLMAVIVVGDFDPDQVEAWIVEKFSALESPANPRERPEFEIPDHDDIRYVVAPDPEVPGASIEILCKHDDPEGTTHRDYRNGLLDQVALSVINERFGEIVRQPDPPFLRAGAGTTKLNPAEGGWTLFAQVADTATASGYEAMLVELARVQRHGFREAEVARAKASVLKRYEKLLLEKDKTDSVSHATEMQRVFLNGESMPGTDYEVELANRYVPDFTLAEFDAWAKAWMPARSRLVTIVMPQKDGLDVPATTDLQKVDAKVSAMEIEALAEEAEIGELLTELPEPGTVTEVHEEHVDDLMFKGWTLSNGVQVWFRKTDFKQDEVRMSAWADGGSSLIGDDRYVSASLANDIAGASGFGAHDATALSKWMAGHSLRVSHGLSEHRETISGNSSVDDFERLLQLVHASMVAPRLSADGLAVVRTKQEEQLRNRLSRPDTHFYDAYNALVWPDDMRKQPWSIETLDALDLEDATAVWSERFGNASGWTFVFVGNLPEDFEAHVGRYLASLPTDGEAETYKDRGHRPKAGTLTKEVKAGLEPKARVRIEYHGDLEDNSWLTRNRLYGMGSVLSVLLREELREELGGVYGVSVRAREAYLPWDNYTVQIMFGCDPERVDELVAATNAVVDKLRKEGPDPSYVAQEQEKNRRSREDSLRDNGFWLSSFAGALQRGADPKAILTWDERNDALSAEVVQQAAVDWLQERDRIQVVLLPQDGDEG